LLQLQLNFSEELFFIPNRGNFSRGIFASTYLKYEGTVENAIELYEDFYKDAPFTHISKVPIHLKQAVNTNNCFIHLEKHNSTLLITSVIDNLLKGASGQAIQNMNLMLGFKESEGLNLKASAF
jgi:N-acetyl-gamma-glutamyl-phosphate reductase